MVPRSTLRRGTVTHVMTKTIATAIGMLSLFGSPSSHATDDVLEDLDLPLVCNEDLVAGVYGFNAAGFVVEVENGRLMIVEGARQAGNGVIDFRADGTATFRLERFFSGIPGTEGGPFLDVFEASWTVRSDCTGTADLTEFGSDVDWIFVAVENANELHLASGAGTLAQVDAKRLLRR